MKKIILLLTISMILQLFVGVVPVMAEGGGIPATYDLGPGGSSTVTGTVYSDGKLVISGDGPMNDYIDGCMVPYYSVNKNIKSIVINSGVTTIGEHMFHGCENAASITIPDTVTSIGEHAFLLCTSLTSVTFGESPTIKSIGNYAFRGCTSLDSFTIPSSVTSIGMEAFFECTGLTSVTFVGISSLERISEWLFRRCTALTSIVIPSSVTYIDAYAFNECSNLTSITNLHNGRQAISVEAFATGAPDPKTATAYPANENFISAVRSAGYTVSTLTETAITAAEVTGITAPVAGAVPVTAGSLATGDASCTVTGLTWQNSDGSAAALTAEGKFEVASTYQAVIELTAAAGYKFQALTPTVDAGTAGAGTINEDAEGNKLTFTVTFDPTAALQVTGIAVTTQPAKLSYTEGTDGILALNGMVVTETNKDGSTATVTFIDGTAAGYTTDPANGTALTNAAHNNSAVTVTHTASGLTARTNNLVVNTAPPASHPGAPTNITATAGNGQVAVSFTPPADNGGSTITGYTVTSNPGNFTATGASTTIIVTGLSNGTAYTFTVTASNAAGTGPASATSNAATPYRHSSGGSTPSTPPTPSVPPANTGVDILVNGRVETVATVTTTKVDGKIVATIVVDDKKVEEMLQQEGNNAVVTIPVKNDVDVVIGTLNGQTVKNMENTESVLEIITGSVTYTLPASQINIDTVSEQIGKQMGLKDIAVSVKISEPAADTVKIVEDTADKNNYQIMVKPIEFEITCSSGNKTVEVSKFNAYVERLIEIPEGIDPSKITTGIILNEDGSFSHVPTAITIIDGKYYAKINSLTNSVYSVIYSPKAFKDVEAHWAKDAVNDMGSRLVISGVGEDNFEPDRDIARAEFAAIAVRALGLMRPETGNDVFNDVPKDAWYYDAVSIAYEYGIIAGYGSGQFGPMDKITREQAMTMVARAMKITNLEAGMTDSEESKVLAAFTDANSTADYAKTGIATCVKTGIISGRSKTTLAPKDDITRAEVAVIVRRLLQQSGLI